MDTAAILTVYRFTHLTIERNLEGLTDPEALVAPAPGGSFLGFHQVLGKAGAIA